MASGMPAGGESMRRFSRSAKQSAKGFASYNSAYFSILSD
jgi:hypothetical protein